MLFFRFITVLNVKNCWHSFEFIMQDIITLQYIYLINIFLGIYHVNINILPLLLASLSAYWHGHWPFVSWQFSLLLLQSFNDTGLQSQLSSIWVFVSCGLFLKAINSSLTILLVWFVWAVATLIVGNITSVLVFLKSRPSSHDNTIIIHHHGEKIELHSLKLLLPCVLVHAHVMYLLRFLSDSFGAVSTVHYHPDMCTYQQSCKCVALCLFMVRAPWNI